MKVIVNIISQRGAAAIRCTSRAPEAHKALFNDIAFTSKDGAFRFRGSPAGGELDVSTDAGKSWTTFNDVSTADVIRIAKLAADIGANAPAVILNFAILT